MDPHAQRMRSYIDALEEEKHKIQVFHRELPLCLDLVNKAIENYRQQLSGTTTECVHGGHSECSEQTWPVLEEFIPIKRPCSGSDCDNDDETDQDSGHEPSGVNGGPVAAAASNDNKRKSDWLRSAQLWNQTASDPPPKDDPPPKRVPVLEVKRDGGAFQPFNSGKDTIVNISLTCKPLKLSPEKSNSVVPSAATSSMAETVAASPVSSQKGEREPVQPHRKQRRNWSPELHRRFLQALQQLGGSHTATPKQIRELMKVDGLTNDEVKSHLQKYRLHTRRPGPATIPASGTAQGPQFVVVGGIWVPPVEYAAASTLLEEEEAGKATVLYAPQTAAPPVDKRKKADECEGMGSHSAGGEGNGERSNSLETSSSTRTTTGSASHPH
ncbi:hypothetical protein MLD38_004391 [Melastoma candidum]|uniref:Uncharacterized protein n=1 Tax=Melastoma candidum TaxID=119954 RepID=A0ACB9S520_9MYRT|nr:hypothetical protein MLD38_004391 [Melastoma candidum]